MAPNPQHSSRTLSDRLLTLTWLLRIPQFFLAVAIFAVAITNARDFQSMSCTIPHNMEMSVICAGLSIIALPYLLLFSPPLNRFHLFPRPAWIATILDSTFLIFYLIISYYVSEPGAACRDICKSCGSMWEQIDGCGCRAPAAPHKHKPVPTARVHSSWSSDGIERRAMHGVSLGGYHGVPLGGDITAFVRRRRMGVLGKMGVTATVLFLLTAAIFALQAFAVLSDRDSRRRQPPARRKPLTPIEEGQEFEGSVELSGSSKEVVYLDVKGPS